MEKIIIKKQAIEKKYRRASVAVKPEMYVKIQEIAAESNQSIETIVNILLGEAIKHVEIV